MSPTSAQETGPQTPGGASMSWLALVILACVGGIALSGMFIGFYDTVTPVGQPGYTTPPAADAVGAGDPVPQAVVYSDMTGARFGPNANWQPPWAGQAQDPTQHYDLVPADAASRDAANAQREQRRAYSGAPPVVPHAIDQKNAASCLVCHGQGMKIGQVVAPKMSHETYTNCTQCHVESTNRALPPTTGPRAAASLFEGLESPGPGERLARCAADYPAHHVDAQNCNSCHGTLADKGLQTSHPWRINCVQCHAPSADMDQWQALAADRPPIAVHEKATP